MSSSHFTVFLAKISSQKNRISKDAAKPGSLLHKSTMNSYNKLRINLKPSFWNEDQITVKNAFKEFEEFDMRLDEGRMQAIELLALYLAIESKFWHWGQRNGSLSMGV